MVGTVITAEARITATDATGSIFDRLARKVEQTGRSLRRSIDIGRQAKSVEAVATSLGTVTKAGQSVAKAAIGKELDRVATSARQAVIPIRGFGQDFRREVSEMKMSAREIRGIARDYVKMHEDQHKALAAIANPRIRQQLIDRDRGAIMGRLRDRVRASRTERALIAELTGPGGRRSRIEGDFGRGAAGGLVGAASAGGLGYGASRVVRQGARIGAEAARESARDYLAGIEPDSPRLKREALDLSIRYPSVEATTFHERLRDTSLAMGSTDKGLEVKDTIGRLSVVLQSLKGKEQALEEGRGFFKALDNLGRTDPGQVKRLADGYVRSLGVEGADMNMGDIYTMAKTGKSGGAALSEKFLMTSAPSLMQDLGPARLGTALGSSVSQVIGGRATKETKREQQRLGLRDRKGNFRNADEIMSDPFAYTINRLLPAFEKKKIDVNDNTAVVAALSKVFSNQVVADLFAKMITQREQYQRKEEQYGKAPGLEAADRLQKEDPFVAAAAAQSGYNNALTAFSERAMPGATAALNTVAELFNRVAKGATDNPQAVGGAAKAAAAPAAAGALWGAGAALKALAGEGHGVTANALRLLGNPTAVIGRVLSKATVLPSLGLAVGEITAASDRQFGHGPVRGPGSRQHARRVKQDAAELAAIRAEIEDPLNQRSALLRQELARNAGSNRALDDNVLGGAYRSTRKARLAKERSRLVSKLEDADEQVRERNRGRDFGRLQVPDSHDVAEDARNRARLPIAPLPGAGFGALPPPLSAGMVKAELTGSADVKGEVRIENRVLIDSSGLARVVTDMQGLVAKVGGILQSGSGGATSMPHLASPGIKGPGSP